MWPKSNTSNSGLTPAFLIRAAISSIWGKGLAKTRGPKFMDPTSNEQSSGLSLTTCAVLFKGVLHVVPGARPMGSALSGTIRAPAPVVKLISMLDDSLIRWTASSYNSKDMDGSVVSGSLTWICTTEAPAEQASKALSAISPGVTGRAGCFVLSPMDPVTAKVIMVLFSFMFSVSRVHRFPLIL